LLAKGVPTDKVEFIPNWANIDLYAPQSPDPVLARDLSLAGKFNVMFAGNIGEAQALETVLEAARLLTCETEVQIVIVGDGVALESLKTQAHKMQLSNVLFLGRHRADEMPKLYALADALLVHLRDEALFRITVPHKILAYLASGKPLIAAIAGEGASIVENARAGVSCPPENPEAMAKAVREMYSLSPEIRTAMGLQARQTAEDEYGRLQVVRQIEAVLQRAVVKQG
jgi:glycosyltransferase involved in cell wall biosynthesis